MFNTAEAPNPLPWVTLDCRDKDLSWDSGQLRAGIKNWEGTKGFY